MNTAHLHTVIDSVIRIALTDFFYKADTQLTRLIIQKNFHPLIIKKELEYANKSRFGQGYIIAYSLTYTLFEDVTGSRGERPNDIFMDVMLFINTDGKIQLTRHIGCGFDSDLPEDKDYDVYLYEKESFHDFVSKLDMMLDDFKEYLIDAIHHAHTLR